MRGKVAALMADAFQDSEYFLPKIALEDQLGLQVEVISLRAEPIEIYSYFSRIGMLDVTKTIAQADYRDYVGVLVPGGAKSPALLSENEAVLSFLRQVDGSAQARGIDLQRFPAGGDVRYCQRQTLDRVPLGQGVPRSRDPADRGAVRGDLER
jgi:hypothetical protein